jgi:hypothetical protein
MQRQRVQSSNVYAVGYDEQVQMLEVEFHSGSIYQYANVPLTVYRQFMRADSKGKFLNAVVKKTYSYRKVA